MPDPAPRASWLSAYQDRGIPGNICFLLSAEFDFDLLLEQARPDPFLFPFSRTMARFFR